MMAAQRIDTLVSRLRSTLEGTLYSIDSERGQGDVLKKLPPGS